MKQQLQVEIRSDAKKKTGGGEIRFCILFSFIYADVNQWTFRRVSRFGKDPEKKKKTEMALAFLFPLTHF